MATTEDLTQSGDSITIGGVIFQDSANIGSGTGNYETFLAVGDNDGNEAGFNSDDTSPIEPSNNNLDLAKSETLLLGHIPITMVGGVAYYEFRVDLNEPNSTTTGQISLDTFRIYTSASNQIMTLTQLQSANMVYDMDLAYGQDVSLLLSEVSTGSGTDDYSVLIPVSLFGNADPASTYLYLYVGMGFVGGDFAGNSGFEEWNTQQAGTLTGFKFSDVDSDGVWDAGEVGVGGVTVFIDEDKDGVLDANERSTVTNADGSYTFFGVPLGTWQIDEVVPAGSTQTTGAFETATISLMGQNVVVDPIGNHYPVPRIDIVKDFASVTDGPDGGAASTTVINGGGDVANYTIAVTNNGETGLVNVVVTDPLATTLTEQTSGGFNTGDTDKDHVLDIGETWYWNATQTASQADVDNNGGGDGDLDNVAYVTADQEGATQNHVSDSDDAAAPIARNPAIDITKSGTTGDDCADEVGETVTWTMNVTNTGNVTLQNVVVTDPNAPNVHYVSGDDGDNLLELGETWVYQATHVVTQADIDGFGGGDGDLDNTATVTGTAVSSTTTVSDSASADVDVCQDPALSITKSGTTGDDCADEVGETITWTINVTNTGNVAMQNIVVTDPNVANVVYSSGDNGNGVLDVGETWVYTGTQTVTQAMINAGVDVENVAYASGEAVVSGEDAAQVSDDASVEVCQDPVIYITKSGTTDQGDDCVDVIGENVVWRIEVSRGGNVDIDNVVVTDTRGTPTYVSGDDGDNVLEAGETWVYELKETVTQAMINANATLLNTATANGEAVNSNTAAPTVSDDASVEICQNPVLQIVKTGTTSAGDDCVDVVGENIVWTIAVSRAGNVDIDNVAVTDNRGTPVYVSGDDGDNVLEAGEVWYYTFSETVTQAMINANTTIVNTAYANGEAVNSSEAAAQVSDDASVEVCQNPALTITKSGTTDQGDDCADVVGENIVWTINVTRAGNVDLDNVVVTDNRFMGGAVALTLAGGDDGDGVLEAGETWTYTFSEVVTQAMINANATIVNTAYANGEAVNSSEAAATVSDDASVEVCQDPVLVIDKTGTTDKGDDCADVIGETITWTISVSRAGNVDIDNVVVTDSRGTPVYVSGDDGDNVLEANETWIYELKETVTQAMINANATLFNTAYANGEAVNSSEAAAQVSDDASVEVCQDPVLVIDKTGTTDKGDDCVDVIGETITWTISVSRAGNVDIDNVVVTDSRGTPVYVSGDDGDNVLEANETWIYELKETVTQAMINANATLFNTAYANGEAVNSSEAAAQVSDDASVEVCQDPVLQISKTGTTSAGDDCIDVVGENIVWTINVSRAGNVDIDNVVVTDNRFMGGAVALTLAGGDDGDGVLEAGETWTYTFTETATQAMIDANQDIVNTAYANGEAVNSSEAAAQVSDDATVEVCQNPAINLEKYVLTDQSGGYLDADDPDGPIASTSTTVNFRVSLINTGNVALGAITLADSVDHTVGGVVTTEALDYNDAALNAWLDLDGDTVKDAGEEWTALDANGDGTLDSVTLAAGGTLNIYYSLTSALGQHENTATVVATATNGTETATDTDDANYYVLPSEDCVGVGTPGFWSNNGAVFWDGIAGNETKAGQPGFADSELLYAVDSNNDGVIDGSDVKGLLVGDYNHNGLTDAGEDTLFISLGDARTLINASQKQQADGKYMLGRDVVATWLNYLANGGSEGSTACIDRPGTSDDGFNPKHFIDDAIDWLQTFAGSRGNGAPTLADNATNEAFDNLWLGSVAVKTSSSYWSTAVNGVADHSAGAMHSALDAYNNTGIINGVEFCCDRDNADAMFALQQIA